MVRLPTPAARATSSIVVFEYPSTPMSRSAASRIRSRVGVGFIVGSLLRLQYCTILVFRARGFTRPGARAAPRGLAGGGPAGYRQRCRLPRSPRDDDRSGAALPAPRGRDEPPG